MKTILRILIIFALFKLYKQRRCGVPTVEVAHKPAVPTSTPKLTEREIREGTTIAKMLFNSWQSSDRSKRSTRTPSKFSKTKLGARGIRSVKGVKRKEYRQMTTKEMDTFHRCLQLLKASGVYDRLVRQHRNQTAPFAHFGIAFLPWHRHYLQVFENRLRAYPGCAKTFIPYWDSTLDESLPRPQDSVLWSSAFWGKHTGIVTNGKLCKNWNAPKGCKDIGRKITRAVTGRKDMLYSRSLILTLQSQNTFEQFASNRYGLPMSLFELRHGFLHCFVGQCQLRNPGCRGHLGCVECSPSDPVFWMLHSFVDYIWYEWAAYGFTRNFYPHKFQNINLVGGRGHLRNASMLPFRGLENVDGFRLGTYSQYEIRPSRWSCVDDSDCKSPQNLIYCPPSRKVTPKRLCRAVGSSRKIASSRFCKSKIRTGGQCSHAYECYCPKNTPVCLRKKCSCSALSNALNRKRKGKEKHGKTGKIRKHRPRGLIK